MKITERQKEILNSIVGEYIKTAKPVSSQLIEKDYNLEVSTATIRNEMQKLTDSGFIYQPHTSAGRVPTDKGYRFFVDNFLEEKNEEDNLEKEKWFSAESFENNLIMVQNFTKNLAFLSSNLAIGYLCEEKILWKDGWERVLCEPEFKETKIISSFADLVGNFEKEINNLGIDSEIKVYIGRENPFPKAGDFSLIISKCQFPKEECFLAIVGPKRMNYDKNINFLNSLMGFLERI